jgi:hypothetical protein
MDSEEEEENQMDSEEEEISEWQLAFWRVFLLFLLEHYF